MYAARVAVAAWHDEWIGVAYVQAVDSLTEKQVAPLRHAYGTALLALLDEQGLTHIPERLGTSAQPATARPFTKGRGSLSASRPG